MLLVIYLPVGSDLDRCVMSGVGNLGFLGFESYFRFMDSNDICCCCFGFGSLCFEWVEI